MKTMLPDSSLVNLPSVWMSLQTGSLLTVTIRQIHVRNTPLHSEMSVFMCDICRIDKKDQVIKNWLWKALYKV